MKKKTLAALCIATIICGLTACGSTTTDLTGDVPEEDTVEEVEIVEEEPVVDEPIVDDEIVIDEPIVDDEIVVDTPIDVSTSIAYTNVQYKTWGDGKGIAACFAKPDGSYDYAFFVAEMTVQGDGASIKKCDTGITFTAPLDATSLKFAEEDGMFAVTDDTKSIIIIYSDSIEKILANNTDGYSSIRNDYVQVAYNDTITDEQAQMILDSCVYYADGNEMQKQYQFMQSCVVDK